MPTMRRCICALAVLALLAAAVPALASELDRAEYKAKVEPICKSNSEANAHILKGVRAKVRQGKLAAAGRQLIRAAAALRKTLTELRAVPRPAADEARLTEWLKRVSQEATLLQQSGKALKAGNRHRAEVLQVRLYSGARFTNLLVVAFGFHYCSFEPSKYS